MHIHYTVWFTSNNCQKTYLTYLVKRLPKSNTLPLHRIDLKPSSKSFQMVTMHITPRIIEVGQIYGTDTGILQLPCQFSCF